MILKDCAPTHRISSYASMTTFIFLRDNKATEKKNKMQKRETNNNNEPQTIIV